MKIAVIQGSSQKDKNGILFDCVAEAVKGKGHEVINFGIFNGEEEEYSYVETAVCISLLLESGAVDFVVTGCSSGQGMMLACNSLPGILCGYVGNPSDAYLFGRINNGNAVSFPLGLNFGWAGEINLKCTLEQLFAEPFGMGYPAGDAKRKMEDTRKLKEMNQVTKRTMAEVLPRLDKELVEKAMGRKIVSDYIGAYGNNRQLMELLNR